MIRNYIKMAVRNLTRDRFYAGINIFGLGMGMACAMLVILFVRREMSYDQGFKDHDKIYRISTRFFAIGDFAGGSPMLSTHLRDQSWVELATKVIPMAAATAKYEQTKINVSRVAMADSSFFKVFSYPFVEGSRNHALTDPNTVVISKETASMLFGDAPAVGKLLTFDGNKKPFQIVGVFDNSGILTHLHCDVLMTNNEANDSNPWWSVGPLTYIKVKDELSKGEVEKYMKSFVKSTVFPSVVTNPDTRFEDWYASDQGYRFFVFPLTDIYFDARLKFEPFVGGDFSNVIIFSVIGLLIVVIASFNFINLSTAQAIRRATEVGIRKTLGSGKLQLMAQFMMESMLISLMATVVAMGFTELLIMLAGQVVGINLPLGVFSDKSGVALLLGFAILVGVISAVYPSIYLTRFSPARVIKGSYTSGKPGFLRNILVVLQFTISIALIIGSLVIYQQLNFMQNKDLGFDQDNSVIIKNLYAIPNQEQLRTDILNLTGIKAASITDRTPGDQNSGVYSITEDGTTLNFEHIATDEDFIPILDLAMIDGRNFDRQRKADTASVIVNQKAAELLGLSDPVGKTFDDNYTIIGVVSDFHFKSLRDEIGPLLIFNNHKMRSDENNLLVKIAKNAPVQDLLAGMQKLWQKYNPDATFEYSFLDQNYARIMENDARVGKAISLLTVVAIIISLLGLMGLCSYTVERKTKEIGIRKVLGASWQNIVILLSKQFVRLVIVAFVISVPVAWYFTKWWLADFAYHIDPAIWVFAAGAVIAVVPTWLMISAQSVTAAKANPTDSLRDE